MAIAALRAGKHVIPRKPFALNGQEAGDGRREHSGLVAMVAHEFRFASGRMLVRELLNEGYLGQPRFAFLRLAGSVRRHQE